MGPVVGGDAGTGSSSTACAPRLAARSTSATPTSCCTSTSSTRSRAGCDGPAYQAQFPGGINVEWITGPNAANIDLVVCERGAGVTQACGTGASAAVGGGVTVGTVDRHGHRSHAGRRGRGAHAGDGASTARRRDAAGPAWGPRPTWQPSSSMPWTPGSRHRDQDRHGDERASRAPGEERDHRGGFGEFGGEAPAGSSTAPSASASCWSACSSPPQRGRRRRCDLDELAELVDTAGADAVGRVVQRRDAPDPATFVGQRQGRRDPPALRSGRRRHRGVRRRAQPAQQFNLEKLLGRTAIDRTAVILDIFAQNATTLGGQGAGRAGPAALPAAAPARPRGPAQPAGRRHRHAGPGRDAARGRPPPHPAPHRTSSRASSPRCGATAPTQRKARRRSPLAHVSPSSATRTPASRRCSTASPTPACSSRTGCSPRSTRPRAAGAARRRDGAADRHRRVRPQAARTTWSRRSVRRSRWWPRPTCSSTSSTRSAPDPEAQIDAVRAVLAEIGAGEVPELLVVNKVDVDAGRRVLADRLRGDRRGLAQHRRRRRRAARWPSPTDCAAHRRRRVARPLRPRRRARRRPSRGRGAGRAPRRRRHRACRPASSRPASARSGSSSSDDGDDAGPTSRHRRRRRARAAGMSGPVSAASCRRPYPYDRLDALKAVADAHPGRVRRPLGRHADRPAAAGRGRGAGAARTPSAATRPRSAPPSCARPPPAGSQRRLGVDVDPAAHVAACIGTKEFVAGAAPLAAPARTRRATPSSTRRSATRPTRWGPRWPAAGRCRCRSTTSGGLDLDAIDADDAARALCLWVEHARQPRRRARRPRRRGASGAGATACRCFSDECYVEFTWDGPPRTILEHGIEACSRSTRCRSGRTSPASASASTPATPTSSTTSPRCASTPGSWCPGPVQAAAVAALADDAHVDAQRDRYRRRLERCAASWPRLGVDGDAARRRLLPLGAGARRRRLGARRAGWPRRPACSSAPASSTARPATGYVRIAVVQPDEPLDLVAAAPGRRDGGRRRRDDARPTCSRSPRELVDIPSESHDEAVLADPSGGRAPVARGSTCTDRRQPGRPHRTRPARAAVLAGHIDTVPANDNAGPASTATRSTASAPPT